MGRLIIEEEVCGVVRNSEGITLDDTELVRDVDLTLVNILTRLMLDHSTNIYTIVSECNALIRGGSKAITIRYEDVNGLVEWSFSVSSDRLICNILKSLSRYIPSLIKKGSKNSFLIHRSIDYSNDTSYDVEGPILHLLTKSLKSITMIDDVVDYSVVSDIAELMYSLITVNGQAVKPDSFMQALTSLESKECYVLSIKLDDKSVISYEMTSKSLTKILSHITDKIMTKQIEDKVKSMSEFSYLGHSSRHKDD